MVKKGDTLGAIARRYRVTRHQIMRWNNLKERLKLRIGQTPHRRQVMNTDAIPSSPLQPPPGEPLPSSSAAEICRLRPGYSAAVGRWPKPTGAVHYGTIADGDRVIDDVLLATVFRAPHLHSIRANSVEISCHGSSYIVSEILLLTARATHINRANSRHHAYLAGKLSQARSPSPT